MSDSASLKASILVADDMEANRELLAGLLTAEGFRVTCAEDGDLALAALRQEVVDLVLHDVRMPGATGCSARLAIKSQPETRLIPVVLVTSLASIDDRMHGIMCGADDFLSKPVNKHELLARVRSLLRLKEFAAAARCLCRDARGSPARMVGCCSPGGI